MGNYKIVFEREKKKRKYTYELRIVILIGANRI